MLTRRGLIGTLLAAPVIIRPGVLMPVKAPLLVPTLEAGSNPLIQLPNWWECSGFIISNNGSATLTIAGVGDLPPGGMVRIA